MEEKNGRLSGSREPGPDGPGPAGFDPGRVRNLLRQRVDEAGSILAFAKGDQSLVGSISRALRGERPVTAPKVLDLLGLELVILPKRSEQ
jgi:hypothetical protein